MDTKHRTDTSHLTFTHSKNLKSKKLEKQPLAQPTMTSNMQKQYCEITRDKIIHKKSLMKTQKIIKTQYDNCRMKMSLMDDQT